MKKAQKTTKKRASYKYRITMQFNGMTFKKSTNDIKATILALKPELLFTDIYVTVNKDIDRKLNLVQGKRLFMSEDSLDIFINNLLLS